MSSASKILDLRNKARIQLTSLLEQPSIVNVIHYACENFNNLQADNSPRITVIAVRNFDSGQTKTFSLEHEAELQRILMSEISQNLDTLESGMLGKFYELVKNCENHKWLHWNMRDTTFGFNAIANRYKVLENSPISIPDGQLFDLSQILVEIYGENYISHLRMQNLFQLNGLMHSDFLTGAEEAEAFEKGEYSRISKSTQRKTHGFSNIVKKVQAKSLKTENSWHRQYGWLLRTQIFVEAVYANWIFKLVVMISVLYSICNILVLIYRVLLGD